MASFMPLTVSAGIWRGEIMLPDIVLDRVPWLTECLPSKLLLKTPDSPRPVL